MPKRTKPRSDANDTTTPTPTPPSAAAPRRRRSTRAKHTSGVRRADGRTTDKQATQPAEAEIRQRAYHLYLERGAAHGWDFDDWIRAERELKRKRVRS